MRQSASAIALLGSFLWDPRKSTLFLTPIWNAPSRLPVQLNRKKLCGFLFTHDFKAMEAGEHMPHDWCARYQT